MHFDVNDPYNNLLELEGHIIDIVCNLGIKYLFFNSILRNKWCSLYLAKAKYDPLLSKITLVSKLI